MLEIRFLAGAHAGCTRLIDKYPCVLGRSKQAGIPIEEPGVWERHIELRLDPQAGFTLSTFPETVALLNGSPLKESRIRNGDIVDVGAARFQVWLTEARRKNRAWLEGAAWAAVAFVCISQIVLIAWLLR